MFPVGTEVKYRGQYGVVKFVDLETRTMTVCIRNFPDEPVRDVCLVLYRDQFDEVELVVGNHSRQNY
jgi:hypothetical protein